MVMLRALLLPQLRLISNVMIGKNDGHELANTLDANGIFAPTPICVTLSSLIWDEVELRPPLRPVSFSAVRFALQQKNAKMLHKVNKSSYFNILHCIFAGLQA